MLINRILAVAIVAGFFAGACVSLVHLLWTAPLIQAAEVYEVDAPGPAEATVHVHDDGFAHHHGTSAHDHDGEAWMPADGVERAVWTAIANVVIGVGVGLVIAALFSLRRRVDLRTGLLWGAGGFLAVGVAPALGLPPELPGMPAADLAARQAWWIGCVVATGIGLLMLAYSQSIWARVLAVMLMVAPHAIGAPQPAVHDTAVPEALIAEFITAAIVASAVFWLAIGAGVGWFGKRWLGEANETAVRA